MYVICRPLPDLDPGKSYKTYFNYESQNKGESDNEDEDEDESLRRRKLKKKDVLPPPSLRDIEAEALESEAGPSNVPAAPLPPPELAKDGRKLTKKEIKAVSFFSFQEFPKELDRVTDALIIIIIIVILFKLYFHLTEIIII